MDATATSIGQQPARATQAAGPLRWTPRGMEGSVRVQSQTFARSDQSQEFALRAAPGVCPTADVPYVAEEPDPDIAH